MAEVFLAMSPQNHPVILRRLLSKYRFNFFKRHEFLRGLRIQATLGHANVIRILELLPFQLTPFAVMEYVEGINLREAMIRHDPSIANGVEIFRQMLEGLEHIHRSGYLHLDFKPENIFVSRWSEVKILDFDLAMPVPKRPKPLVGLEGTPTYVAPEHILKRPVDERADIFSLGVTAFELFTGQKPFQGLDQQDIFHAYTDLDTHFRSAHAVRPEVTPSLARILANCLEKRPERRYPSVSLILHDLHDLQNVT